MISFRKHEVCVNGDFSASTKTKHPPRMAENITKRHHVQSYYAMGLRQAITTHREIAHQQWYLLEEQ